MSQQTSIFHAREILFHFGMCWINPVQRDAQGHFDRHQSQTLHYGVSNHLGVLLYGFICECFPVNAPFMELCNLTSI